MGSAIVLRGILIFHLCVRPPSRLCDLARILSFRKKIAGSEPVRPPRRIPHSRTVYSTGLTGCVRPPRRNPLMRVRIWKPDVHPLLRAERGRDSSIRRTGPSLEFESVIRLKPENRGLCNPARAPGSTCRAYRSLDEDIVPSPGTSSI